MSSADFSVLKSSLKEGLAFLGCYSSQIKWHMYKVNMFPSKKGDKEQQMFLT